MHMVLHIILAWTSCTSVMKMLLVGVRFKVLFWQDVGFMCVYTQNFDFLFCFFITLTVTLQMTLLYLDSD